MWLLDANLDIHLAGLLRSFQIDCDTAESRDWKALRNGELVSAAANSGFDTLLTRDLLFAESAARAWRTFPDFGIYSEASATRSKRYLEAFLSAWSTSPICPQAGKIVLWPASAPG